MTVNRPNLRHNRQKRNRKGSARDIILFAILLFTLAIGLFLARYISTTITEGVTNTTAWQETGNHTNINSTAVMETGTDTVGLGLDYVFLGIFIGLIVGIIVTGWIVGGHPIFMVFYLLLIIIAVVLSIAFADVFDDVTNLAVFGATINDFEIMTHIMQNLPFYTAITGTIGIIVMFGKPGSTQRR